MTAFNEFVILLNINFSEFLQTNGPDVFFFSLFALENEITLEIHSLTADIKDLQNNEIATPSPPQTLIKIVAQTF